MKIELNNQLIGINSTIKSFKEIIGEKRNDCAHAKGEIISQATVILRD